MPHRRSLESRRSRRLRQYHANTAATSNDATSSSYIDALSVTQCDAKSVRPRDAKNSSHFDAQKVTQCHAKSVRPEDAKSSSYLAAQSVTQHDANIVKPDDAKSTNHVDAQGVKMQSILHLPVMLYESEVTEVQNFIATIVTR